MPERKKPNEQDVGAALMAWYAEAIQEHPAGLVTQAQAATMLGISRVALSRLVGRGYLRAVYFPKPPDIVGMSIGSDDPFWLKMLGWFGPRDTYAFPKACYVSFADVMELWQSGEAQEKCKRNWNEVMAYMDFPTKAGDKRSFDRLKKIQAEFQRRADQERELKRLKNETGHGGG